MVVNQKDQTATGDKAIYDISDDTVRLFPAPGGQVVVTQGPNIVRGPRLTVHLATGISHFESDGHDGGVYSLIIPNAMKNENQNANQNGNQNHAAPTAQKTPPRAAQKPRSNSPSDLY